MFSSRVSVFYVFGIVLLILCFIAIIFVGTINIPVNQTINVLVGNETVPYVKTIILETRLPMAIAALCCGSLLSVAGLMMQTLFLNPLAGPSVLGISSGASFGVALMLLSASGLGALVNNMWFSSFSVLGAVGGSLLTILILYFFASILKTNVALLIVGIMISYLCSSGISLLNYFSQADEIRNFLVWGMGSFSSLRLSTASWLLGLTIIILIPSVFFIKPLNAMLMGERYIESIGYSIRKLRGQLLIVTGVLVAIPTAFCGPIGFIGLIVPHLCRLLFSSSNHIILIPASILYGAVTGLLCAFLSVLPSSVYGVLPINVITPIIGVPVILYLLIKRNKLPYFS